MIIVQGVVTGAFVAAGAVGGLLVGHAVYYRVAVAILRRHMKTWEEQKTPTP